MQALLFFDRYFTVLFIVLTFLMLAFKSEALGFPSGQFGIEALVIVSYAMVSWIKIAAGMKGNRSESISDMLLMVFMGVFALLCNVYFMLSQTYIMVIELVLNGIALGFTGFELLMGLVASISFLQYSRQDEKDA